MRLFFATLAALMLSAQAIQAQVIIQADHGGMISEYLDRYEQIKKSGERVVIDGNCFSACTLVLGIVPPERICVTSRANLGFHTAWFSDGGRQAYSEAGTGVLLENYPRNILAWFNRYGGLSYKMLYLEGAELARMYQPCGPGTWQAATSTPPLRMTIRPPKPFHAHGLY